MVVRCYRVFYLWVDPWSSPGEVEDAVEAFDERLEPAVNDVDPSEEKLRSNSTGSELSEDGERNGFGQLSATWSVT